MSGEGKLIPTPLAHPQGSKKESVGNTLGCKPGHSFTLMLGPVEMNDHVL